MRYFIFFLLIGLFYLTDNAFGQKYRFHHYRVEQGLPSDVIKAVTQDSLGFFWIATDDGLVKYDGLRFSTYKDAVPGQYVKGFLHTAGGRLIAFGDMSAIEIINQVDTVIFKPFLRGERVVTDSTLFFPKSIYQDRSGNIWFGEPKSVVKYDGKKLTRYDLGEANRSGVFVRSFSFFEDDAGHLYTTSYTGNIFRYSKAADKLVPAARSSLTEDISMAMFLDGKLLLAARSGLFVAEQNGQFFEAAKNILPVGQISHLLLAPDSSVLVSTYGEDLYKLRFAPEPRAQNFFHNFNGINATYVSRDGDIWASTDKGLILVQQNLFVIADAESQTHFIEGIAYDAAREKLYYCNKEVLVELSPAPSGEWKRKKIEEDKNAYFQCLQFDGDRLWASTRWEVLIVKDSRVIRRFDFSSSGNFVHDLFFDSRKNMWLSQAGTSTVKMVDSLFQITAYELDNPTLKDINVIREGRNGMYLSTSGLKGYLYFKPHGEDVFRNISVPIPSVTGTDFNVTDMAVDKNDELWLATTEGLMHFSRGQVSRVIFDPEFDEYPVTSVEVLDETNILFSNSFGLFRYNTDSREYWLYDENTGLPSNTITDHGIFVSREGKVWIGTSYGLAGATRSLLSDRRTPKPFCVEARVNGSSTRFKNSVIAPHGSFVTLRFSPISFPENRVTIQWRLSNENSWHSVQNNQVELSDVKHGSYRIVFRAKKNTGLTWSDENFVDLTVRPPYWKKPEFAVAVLLLVSLIAWGSYAISARIMNKRRQYLEAQINERTQELRIANTELTQRNAELDRFVYSASHDLSAPLKSILGLISVAKMDSPSPGQLEYLRMMERSVQKLEMFIQEVVTYSRNARMPVRYEEFEFEPFVQGILQDHEYSENYKKITFIVEDNLERRMISDVTRMKIILNNLLSNAIKFHWLADGRKPVVRIGLHQSGQTYVLEVSDNGRGIHEEHIKRIFEMFYRASEGTQGSGLGLYILKESVLKLGGTVEADSRLEHGTTFTIRLPIPEIAAV